MDPSHDPLHLGEPGTGFVGVDVVDLTRHRTANRSADRRFLDRVFSVGEQARIREASDPELEVWMLWAAKEAAFKVVSKLDGAPPVFRHRAFEIVDAPGDPHSALRYGSRIVSLSAQATGERVLVHAWDDPSSFVVVSHATMGDAAAELGVEEPLEKWQVRHFAPEEVEAVHGPASALVRLLARREAAFLLGVSEDRLSIVCPRGRAGLRPPYLHLDGSPMAGADVSLSHDGAYLAWALRIPWAP